MTPRVAILIDGGFFLKVLPSIQPWPAGQDHVKHVVKCLDWLVSGHLSKLNETYQVANPFALLYRVFYYDARPYDGQEHKPKSGRAVHYRTTPQAEFRNALFDAIRDKRKFALRLGHVYREKGWHLKEVAMKALHRGERTFQDLTDDDFYLGLRQKGVDMRIGMDISTITLKRQANIIVLVSGDTDFVSVAKLARREGVEFILDPMWLNVAHDLHVHTDGIWSGLRRANQRQEGEEDPNVEVADCDLKEDAHKSSEDQ